MDPINRSKLETFATTISLSEETWEILVSNASKVSIQPSELLILCLKCSSYEKIISKEEIRATVSYNPETCGLIKKIYLTEEEHHSVQAIRCILKISVSFYISIAITEYAERITLLLLKENKNKNFWIVEKWIKNVERELMNISRKVLNIDLNILDFGITMIKYKGKDIISEELVENRMKKYFQPGFL